MPSHGQRSRISVSACAVKLVDGIHQCGARFASGAAVKLYRESRAVFKDDFIGFEVNNAGRECPTMPLPD